MAAGFFPAAVVAACGCKLPGGEGDPGEHLAGIFRKAWIVAAFLGGDGVIQNRYDQLGIPLQPDDGKLAQSHIEPAVIPTQSRRFVEHLLNEVRNLNHGAFLAFVPFPDFGTQNHGIQNFHH